MNNLEWFVLGYQLSGISYQLFRNFITDAHRPLSTDSKLRVALLCTLAGYSNPAQNRFADDRNKFYC